MVAIDNIANAKAVLMTSPVDELLQLWSLTETAPATASTFAVRGWIMDALELRDRTAFWRWIDSPDAKPDAFFTAR